MADSKLATVSADLYKRASNKVLRRGKKQAIRYGILAANLVLLIVATMFVVKSSSSTQVVRQSSISSDNTTLATNPLDELSSADIAVEVARITRLDQAVSVQNNADSINDSLAIASAGTSVIAKPQIVSTTGQNKSNRDIQKYITQAGDTVSGLAAKFGVTSNTIRWSNDLNGDALPIGRELLISPVNGIVYKVKPGDSPENLASKYRANKDQIIAFNDAEVSGLKPGELIVIPDGSIQQVRTVSTSYYGFAWGASAIYGYNGYDYGWCTWWAAKRRADIGRPVPTNLGNAYSWYSRAASVGMTVSPNVPIYGAVMWTAGGNHVSFVEKIEPDGSIIVSDMNSRSGWEHIDLTGRGPGYGGWNITSYRRIMPDQFGSKYRFIY